MNKQIPEGWFVEARQEEDREKREKVILANTKSLSMLYDLLLLEKNKLDSSMKKDANYSVASWPYKQADMLGQIKALDHVLNLLKFTKGT